MLKERKPMFPTWAINVINTIKTNFAEISNVPNNFLSALFNFPSYQIYQIILEIDSTMCKYIKSKEINDYNIVAAYYIDSDGKLTKNEVYSIERILKSESKLEKFDFNFKKYSLDVLFICKLKKQNKAFITKRVYWSYIEQVFGRYLTDKLDILSNINNSLEILLLNNNIIPYSNKYLLTTYSDRNILTKFSLKAKYSKTVENEIVFKYTISKEYENARIKNYKPATYKMFRKENQIIDKKLIPAKTDKEVVLFRDTYLSDVNDIYYTILLYDLLENFELI